MDIALPELAHSRPGFALHRLLVASYAFELDLALIEDIAREYVCYPRRHIALVRLVEDLVIG